LARAAVVIAEAIARDHAAGKLDDRLANKRLDELAADLAEDTLTTEVERGVA
jgi:hypothetical protein